MIYFFGMVTISTLLIVRSALRLLRSRFLNPTDLAIIATWYYAVPLAVCGFLTFNPRNKIFLHAAAADPTLAVESMQYCLLAMVALLVGQAAGKAMGPPRLTTYFPINQNGEIRCWIALTALLGITFIGVAQFGFNEFFRGYATDSDSQGATLGLALVYFAAGCFGLVIAYALLIYKTTKSRSLLVLAALSLLSALAILLIRAKRLEVAITLLPAVIVLLTNRKSFKAATSRIVIGATALVGFVAISISRVGDEFDSFSFYFYFLSEGLYAGHSLPGIIARIDAHMVDYEWGTRFLSALLGFVPRFLWPGKDDMVYAGNIALNDLSPLGATSILAEIVLQGGVVAVILCYSLMGIVFERASRFEDGWDQAIAKGFVPSRFIAYLVLATTFIPHFRDGIIPAVKLALQAGAFMLLLVGFRIRPRLT